LTVKDRTEKLLEKGKEYKAKQALLEKMKNMSQVTDPDLTF